MKANRTTWIDIAKGLTIMLMVLGHSNLPNFVKDWIYSFHMPLFFFASGLTTKWERDTFSVFFLKKVKGLLYPFCIYSIICIYILKLTNIGHFNLKIGWQDYALWFVPVLFIAAICTKYILSLKNKGKYIYIIILLILIETFKLYQISLPWNISVIPYAIILILCGSYSQTYINKLTNINFTTGIIFFTISFIISSFWKLDMARNQCTPIIPLTVGAISGTLFITYISIKLSKLHFISNILQKIGQETFIILAFSQIIIQILNKYYTINFVAKYTLLILILIGIKYLKDTIKWCNNYIINKLK